VSTGADRTRANHQAIRSRAVGRADRCPDGARRGIAFVARRATRALDAITSLADTRRLAPHFSASRIGGGHSGMECRLVRLAWTASRGPHHFPAAPDGLGLKARGPLGLRSFG